MVPVKRPEPIARPELLEAIAPLLELLDVSGEDVLYVHVGARKVTVKRYVRSARGRRVHGLELTSGHPIVTEPED